MTSEQVAAYQYLSNKIAESCKIHSHRVAQVRGREMESASNMNRAQRTEAIVERIELMPGNSTKIVSE